MVAANVSALSDLQNREQLEDLDLDNMNGTINGRPSLANGTSSGYFNDLTSTLTGILAVCIITYTLYQFFRTGKIAGHITWFDYRFGLYRFG